MNFDNQGIVSGTFLTQMWVLVLLYRAVYFVENYFKMDCITMGYTIPLKNFEIVQIKCLKWSLNLEFGEKGETFLV